VLVRKWLSDGGEHVALPKVAAKSISIKQSKNKTATAVVLVSAGTALAACVGAA
jgi:hypothetical protein